MDNVKVNTCKAAIFTVGTITALIGLYRCFLGVDLSDEALYISDPFFVAHGAVPYVSNWLQTPGFSFFLAPVVAFYELFAPSHEGIFLFMRLFFLVVKWLMYFCICFLFRNTQYKYAAWLISLPVTLNFFGMLPSLNYTNIPLMGLLLAGILLLDQWYSKAQREMRFLPYVNGVILACITLCSPTQVLNCLIFAGFYYFFIGRRACRQYIVGGLGTALFLTLYMMVKAGSIPAFMHSLDVFLQHPYFSFGSSTLTWQAYNILPMAVEEMIPYVVCIVMLELVRRLAVKKYTVIWSVKNGLAAGVFAGMLITLLRYEQYALWNRVIILLSIGSFFFRFVSGSKGLNRLFDFVAVPEMAAFLGMALTVYGGAANRFYVFVPMALICLMYIYDILKEQIGDKSFYLSVGYVFLFLVITFQYEMQTIYGEFMEGGYVSVSTMTARVQDGVYAGLFTSEEKAAALPELERYLRANTKEDENVLFMDRVPMAYLMTDATPCSPTSWDPVLYTEGKRENITMLEEYFALDGRMPDKIIYIQTEQDRQLSIDQEDYALSRYVAQNYSLEEENVIENLYRVLIYSKNG